MFNWLIITLAIIWWQLCWVTPFSDLEKRSMDVCVGHGVYIMFCYPSSPENQMCQNSACTWAHASKYSIGYWHDSASSCRPQKHVTFHFLSRPICEPWWIFANLCPGPKSLSELQVFIYQHHGLRYGTGPSNMYGWEANVCSVSTGWWLSVMSQWEIFLNCTEIGISILFWGDGRYNVWSNQANSFG
jgi:hypothetical protein